MPTIECCAVTRESLAAREKPKYFFDETLRTQLPVELGQRTSRPPVSARATDLLVRQAQIKLDLSTERYLRLVRELRGAR